jgi:hypothetical protein
MKIQDMPKIESPFIRKMVGNDYLVTNEITPEMEWVFNDDSVLATEKLNGCLHYQVPILTDQGFIMVGKIVNQKLPIKVLSYNFKKKITEFKKIKHYHKEKNIDGFLCVKAKQKYHGTIPLNLIVTPNHKFWTKNGWKRADELKKGEFVFHLTKKLDFIRQQIIFGTLLGDSSLYWGSGKKNCGLSGIHSITQTKYFDLKLKLLGNIIKECKGTKGGYPGSKPNRRFNSVINKHLSGIIKEHCLNFDGKKTITEKWANNLSPIALAIWYMDDGSLVKGNGNQRECAGFATNSFSLVEVKLLKKHLEKYNIKSSIQNSKTSNGNILVISADGSEILFNLISPYIIKEMQYKLPKELRTEHCYWDNYISQNDNDLIKTEILDISKTYKERHSNSVYQYDIEVEDNSNYFAGNILVHNTNVSIVIQEGIVTQIYNRTERIPFINKGKSWIIKGLLNSKEKGYLEFLGDGQFFGELIGPKVNGNPYKLTKHLWIPFQTYCQKHLSYKSWGKYPKDFETISKWFKDDIFSLFVRRRTGEVVKPEGIVFLQPSTGKMAKLRLDMYQFFTGRRH